MGEGMVIVGAGEAGARAAIALREANWAGSITLIGDETHAPYERPPLSKAVITSEAPPTAPFILRDGQLTEFGIIPECDAEATAIDRAAHKVTLADGRLVGYTRLLLATALVRTAWTQHSRWQIGQTTELTSADENGRTLQGPAL
jgi:3-phenylpropionate/trans-cinnamate dioxygenase ferredoxin reductase component